MKALKLILIGILLGLLLFLGKDIAFAQELNTNTETVNVQKINLKVKTGGLDEELSRACVNVVKANLNKYDRFLGSLKTVMIHNDLTLRRGLANASVIYIRCLRDMEEFNNVFIHEIGHVIDLGYLVGKGSKRKTDFDDFGVPIFIDDPSYEFYKISWKDTKTHSVRATEKSFVSRYSQSDPFEDFAEAFLMYEQYNEVFKEYSKTNSDLAAKYLFIQKNLYDTEFTDFRNMNLVLLSYISEQNRVFDATRFHQYFALNL